MLVRIPPIKGRARSRQVRVGHVPPAASRTSCRPSRRATTISLGTSSSARTSSGQVICRSSTSAGRQPQQRPCRWATPRSRHRRPRHRPKGPPGTPPPKAGIPDSGHDTTTSSCSQKTISLAGLLVVRRLGVTSRSDHDVTDALRNRDGVSTLVPSAGYLSCSGKVLGERIRCDLHAREARMKPSGEEEYQRFMGFPAPLLALV